MNSKIIKGLAPIIVGLAVWMIPTPEGLSPDAWTYLALFVAVVVGLILEPVPTAFVGLIGVVIAVVLKIGPPIPADGIVKEGPAINWGLSGFSNSTIWLIFSAFMMAAGYEKSGLGRRISLLLVKALGKTSLGLGYAILVSETILAPFVPSNSARSGGILFPIVKNIPIIYDSYPDKDPRKLGSYIVWVSLLSTCITSSLFYTGLAPNLLAGSIINEHGITFSWFDWFKGIAPVGILLLLLAPILTYLIYPPTMKKAPDAPKWAAEELKKLGPITRKELLMALSAVVALVLWIGSSTFNINGTTTALVVLAFITLAGIISWDDILGNKAAWNVLLWFGTLVTLASGLRNVGFLKWFATQSGAMLEGYSPMTILIALVIIFYFSHYFFASVTSHVTAMLALFLTIVMAVPGIDPKQAALLLGYTLGFMGILTPYGTGPSPIWYGLGYIPTKTFWALGAVFGVILLAVYLAIGVPWIMWVF